MRGTAKRHWVAAFIVLFAGATAWAATAARSGGTPYPHQDPGPCIEDHGGGEVPIPLNTYNQKVELADGELYTLIGNVVITSSATSPKRQQAYLKIDLEQHPWLASAKRKDSPYYPLDGSPSYWKKFEGMRVKMSCLAHGRIVYGEDQEPQYMMFLQPIFDTNCLYGQCR